jgi:hypothetical protein
VPGGPKRAGEGAPDAAGAQDGNVEGWHGGLERSLGRRRPS